MNEPSLALMGVLCTLVLWFYADLGARKLKHIFLAHALTRIRPLLALTFMSLVILLIISAIKPHVLTNIACFVLATVACLYFCYATSVSSADFWAKRRNRALAIAIITIAGMVLVNIEASFVFVSFVYAAIIFHRYRSKEILLLGSSIKDLAAVRQKLSSIDADRRNLKLILSSGGMRYEPNHPEQPNLAG